MMKPKRSFYVFVLFLILSKSAAHQKRMLVGDPYRSFSNDINKCLFNNWQPGILSGNVACNIPGNVQLCYGQYNGGRALFAVCYNTITLIPEFTGHEVQNGGTVAVGVIGEKDMFPPGTFTDKNWHTDEGLVDSKIPVSEDKDYQQDAQKGRFFGPYSEVNHQYLGRGHLTPNGDFSKVHKEYSFTYVTTNIAPQWQPFNMGNWLALEAAVTAYAKQKQRSLYVFTGTGGKAQYNGADIMLNDKVLTPKYYWKAVCDPQIKQSIVFVAENIPGEMSGDPAPLADPGCYAGVTQTKKLGIIKCSSLKDAKAAHQDFKLPPFGVNCNPDAKGTFLDDILTKSKGKLQ